MDELPSGTVTFVLTDIEGSTALWEQAPEAMRAALARHDALLTGGVEARGGVVVKSRGEGDSVFAVFSRASDAIAAAADLQRALQAEPWPPETPLRLRMALHTGEAELRGGDYYGAAVNRCARLRGLAHGGQVLLSEATAVLVRDGLPVGGRLRDLDEHRLRDLTRPERVFQLLHPELPAEFPALRSLDTRPHNLPVQRSPLTGRAEELDEAKQLLCRQDVALLTLTGPPGVGKTRLALQVAAELLDHFQDGAFFVGLAPIPDPSLVASAVAQVLGIRDVGGRPLLESLRDDLRDKQMLLVLDNFEHVLDAAPQVADLLAACPGLKVLATSRAILRLRDEREFPVSPLATPNPRSLPPAADIAQYPAVALFAQQARAASPGFVVTDENAAAVAQICARLDGLPLAIELAAARLKLLPPEALLARLDRRLPLLTGGARDLPARQQTLRATIVWSHDLLDEAERRLFRRLAVFAGGWTLQAAEAVCRPDGEPRGEMLDGVASLVDKSLLRRVGAAVEPRFGMLETVREYALERLEASGEAVEIRRRHAGHYLALAEGAEPAVRGPRQGASLDRLDAEHDNLRAALGWAIEHGEMDAGLRLGGALGRFWQVRGYWTEGREWLTRLLALAGAPSRTAARAKALNALGHLTRRQGDYAAARSLHEEALGISRELGDKPGIAAALNGLGETARLRGDYAEARSLYRESLALARELGDKLGIAAALNNLGIVARFRGDYAEALSLYRDSLGIRQELGDREGMAISLNNLGVVARLQGDYPRARAWHQESLRIRRELRDAGGVAESLNNLGIVARHEDDYPTARASHEESLGIRRDLGDRPAMPDVLNNLGAVLRLQGQYAAARASHEEALTLARELGEERVVAESLEGLAALDLALGRAKRAARLLGASEAMREAIAAPLPPADRPEHDAAIAAAQAGLGTAFADAAAVGRAMSLEQAVTYALEATEPPEPSGPIT